MKKKLIMLLFVIALISTMFSLAACSDSFDDLIIETEDVTDAPVGENTLRYSIPDYENKKNKYNLSVTVRVYDENNNSLSVSNNRTVELEAEKNYTVVVRLNGVVKDKNVVKTASYKIATVHNPRTVYFYLKDGDVVKEYKKISVAYGSDLSINDVPEPVDFYVSGSQTFARDIISREWVIYDSDDNFTSLNQAHLTNITEDIKIYTHYEYNYTPINNYFRFHDGEKIISEQHGNPKQYVQRPDDPQRDGYAFLGWFADKECNDYYNWQNGNVFFSENTDVYAGWVESNAATASSDKNFNFSKEKTDNYGYKYLEISCKDADIIEKNIVLPTEHNGIPVRGFASQAFANCRIESVFIPKNYNLATYHAFAGCQNLVTVTFEKDCSLEAIGTSMFANCGKLRAVNNLPSSVAIINIDAFANCKSLTEITLPQSLYSVNRGAFYGCSSITKVVIPDSVALILEEAFADCSALSEFIIGENAKLMEIYASSLQGTQVKKISLPFSFKENNPFGKDMEVTFYPEKEE